MSRHSVRSAIALGALATLLVSATAMAKVSSPTIDFVWSGNHGDVVASLDPALDSAWSQGDGITDGTFVVAVYWPGAHIRSAHLQWNDGRGDWGAWSGNAYYWGLGLSTTPNAPLLNAGDSSFDLATNAKGWVTFFLHANNYADPESNQFGRGARFTLELCTGADMSGDCLDSAQITIR